MSRRRLTTNAAPTVTSTGESIATSWQVMSCAMPENANTDSAMPSSGVRPAETAATPATRPKGIVPSSTGETSRTPARNS